MIATIATFAVIYNIYVNLFTHRNQPHFDIPAFAIWTLSLYQISENMGIAAGIVGGLWIALLMKGKDW